MAKEGMNMRKIVQAPMAGVTTPEFVVHCSEAGALGSLGAGYMTEEATSEAIAKIQSMTTEPFSVNLFVPEETTCTNVCAARAYASIRMFEERLGLDAAPLVTPKSSYEEQLDIVCEAQVPYVSFTFGLPKKEHIDRLRNEGIVTLVTATSREEAEKVEALGADVVILQGKEAGGHRGSFTEKGCFVALEQLLRETAHMTIPRIAAGGIATEEDARAMFALGADAIQIGTALLRTKESGAPSLHKEMLGQTKKGDFVYTKAFSGKWAQGIRNTFIEEMKGATIAPYPYQNEWTKRMRSESVRQQNPAYVSMWAGEKGYLAKEGSVEEVLQPFLRAAAQTKKGTGE